VLAHAQLPSGPLRIGVAQALSQGGDIDANLKCAARLIGEAADRGAELVLFPEKFLTGYEPELVRVEPERFCISLEDKRLGIISRLCTDRRVTAVVGAPVISEGRRHISSVIFHDDGRRQLYHKQHLYGPEALIYSASRHDVVLHVCGWSIGLAICYDSGFPEHARRLALAGCHVYAIGALFSKKSGRQELRVWMPARALDNTMYVAMSNYCGVTGGWEACGNSGVWNPFGEPIAHAGEDDPELIVVELTPEVLREARSQKTMLRDLRQYMQKSTNGF
jgi:5-aminopentanamidase